MSHGGPVEQYQCSNISSLLITSRKFEQIFTKRVKPTVLTCFCQIPVQSAEAIFYGSMCPASRNIFSSLLSVNLNLPPCLVLATPGLHFKYVGFVRLSVIILQSWRKLLQMVKTIRPFTIIIHYAQVIFLVVVFWKPLMMSGSWFFTWCQATLALFCNILLKYNKSSSAVL